MLLISIVLFTGQWVQRSADMEAIYTMCVETIICELSDCFSSTHREKYQRPLLFMSLRTRERKGGISYPVLGVGRSLLKAIEFARVIIRYLVDNLILSLLLGHSRS